MRVRIDKANRQLIVPVPHFIPARGHRENLHLLLDFALDSFESLGEGSELDERERPPIEAAD